MTFDSSPCSVAKSGLWMGSLDQAGLITRCHSNEEIVAGRSIRSPSLTFSLTALLFKPDRIQIIKMKLTNIECKACYIARMIPSTKHFIPNINGSVD